MGSAAAGDAGCDADGGGTRGVIFVPLGFWMTYPLELRAVDGMDIFVVP